MIIAKTPFRISLAGGGSDIREFYNKHYGAVISTTINKYMYVMIHPYFHDKIRIKYSKLEDVEDIEQIEHDRVRECLRMLGIEKGVEIASIADVPAGTGLGSSSTFTACLLHALYAYRRKYASKEILADKACKIEIDLLNEPIGKQDQYAAAYGGLNYIKFHGNESVSVQPISIKPGKKRQLEKNLLMFYVGGSRDASKILSQYQRNIKKLEKFKMLTKMVELVEIMRICLQEGKIDDIGELLHEGWMLKRKMASGISNSILDDIYNRALQSGASGGKILGAGGNGFFLFYCQPDKQDSLRKALKLRELRFKFESEGSKIIYADN